MTFLLQKNYKKHCMFSKKTFEIPLFLIKKIMNWQLLSAITNMVYVFPTFRSTVLQKLYVMVTFVASSLV